MSSRPVISPINYSCYYSQSREGEQFVQVHSLGIVLSGTMEFDDGQQKQQFVKGDIYMARKDRLLKFVKWPALGGEFKSMSIWFDEETLRSFALEHGYSGGGDGWRGSDAGGAGGVRDDAGAGAGGARGPLVNADADDSRGGRSRGGDASAGGARGVRDDAAFMVVAQEAPIVAFMQSLVAYEQIKSKAELLRLKQKEALLLILTYYPWLKHVLFDFSPPGKIDLEGFMQKNFHFNVRLDRFAYLTGRSLSTFKRDFEKIFHQTPSRWLLHRRLQEAYRLIRQQGRPASDVYLDLGFEDLSHFSYAFKKEFGLAPSRIGLDERH